MNLARLFPSYLAVTFFILIFKFDAFASHPLSHFLGAYEVVHSICKDSDEYCQRMRELEVEFDPAFKKLVQITEKLEEDPRRESLTGREISRINHRYRLYNSMADMRTRLVDTEVVVAHRFENDASASASWIQVVTKIFKHYTYQIEEHRGFADLGKYVLYVHEFRGTYQGNTDLLPWQKQRQYLLKKISSPR